MTAGRQRADQRLRRLLAIVPWVAAHDGPRIDDVCARFGVTETELAEDLGLLFLCGVHPFTPDTLIDVAMDEGRVWIRFADYFSRPLRLTPAEGLALVAAGAGLLSVPGSDADGPLARGLAKLACVLGVDPDEAVGVELGAPPGEVLAVLQQASADRRQVRLEYYSYGRDSWTHRVIDPHQVYNAAGQWYAAAWCHRVSGQRIFRVDRMRDPIALESTFEARSPGRPSPYAPHPDDPLVVLELDPGARWVADEYPNEGVEDVGDGVRIRLRVSARPWLERLLLRLGPHARVVKGDPAVATRAAARVLARYDARVGGP
jgi:proteasome accessory factor C